MTDNYNGEIESMVEHSTFAISDHQHGGEEDRTQSISLFRNSTRRRIDKTQSIYHFRSAQGEEEDRTQSIYLFRSSTRRRRFQNTVDLPVQIINMAEKMTELSPFTCSDH